MKKFLTICMAAACALCVSGQAKKPTLMVMPAEVWCFENGYTSTYNMQGKQTTVPDYERAYQQNSDLYNATTKIGELMAERGFPIKDMHATIRDVNRSAVENEMTTSRTSGATLAETPLEKLMSRAKGDILVELSWKLNQVGPKRSVTYNLRGIDAYTNKQIAAAQGTGPQSFTAEVPVLLEEAVIENMDNFLSQLMAHFDDLLENGREVTINLNVFDNGSDLTFESEFGGEELTDIIDNWMAENTVQHRYSLSDAGETHLGFEQVRIPLYRENGMPMDTRNFAGNLRKFLQASPYNIKSKLITKGLGRVDLILGEK
ncbi:MAG: hypothetical protein HDS04_02675 [Bacteroides sp.]|nr:hypothetical protein [Bacteroides sp.]